MRIDGLPRRASSRVDPGLSIGVLRRLWVLLALAGCLPDLGDSLPATDAIVADGGDIDVGDGAAGDRPDIDVVDVADVIDTSQPAEAGTEDAGDLLAIGEAIFLVQAGPRDTGGGCKQCHGPTGGGDTGIGPNIRGRSEANVKLALRDVTMMDFIRLTETEIDAIVVYLRWLKDTYG